MMLNYDRIIYNVSYSVIVYARTRFMLDYSSSYYHIVNVQILLEWLTLIGDLPHRLQASLWCSTTSSGAVNYKNELLARAVDVSFSLLPEVSSLLPDDLQSFMPTLANSIRTCADVRTHAIALLRKKLVDIGYLNLPAFGAPETNLTNVTLSVFIPVRTVDMATVRGKVNLRKSMAKKQGRELHEAELNEATAVLQELASLGKTTGSTVHSQDTAWWTRDHKLLKTWLGQNAGDSVAANAASFHLQHDPYYRTHEHFIDGMKHVSVSHIVYDRKLDVACVFVNIMGEVFHNYL